jgi:putative glycosyltransferase (TIGR04348 family)
MRIEIVTPAPRGSRRGNRITALRYARLLRDLGHRVRVAEEISMSTRPPEALVALHARKSAEAIRTFRKAHPQTPIVLVLTGTDLYQDLPHSAAARRSLDLATRIVTLQGDAMNYLPQDARRKAVAIIQSCEPFKRQPRRTDAFEVAVVGHLRAVKDPFRTALAARRLPSSSQIRVLQLGACLTPAMEVRAAHEVEQNPRYAYLGDMPRAKALKLLSRCRLTVISSKLEGGPNIVSEAIVAGTPIVSSRISGVIGMLGADYPGYFQVGDTRALTELLRRAESDAAFYAELDCRCQSLLPRFAPAQERAAWQRLLARLVN